MAWLEVNKTSYEHSVYSCLLNKDKHEATRNWSVCDATNNPFIQSLLGSVGSFGKTMHPLVGLGDADRMKESAGR